MPDTMHEAPRGVNTTEGRYRSGGSRATRHHVNSEWIDKRLDVRNILLQAEFLLGTLEAATRPLYADEQAAHARNIAHSARVIFDQVEECLSNFLAPLHRRADEAGIDPDTMAADLGDLRALLEKIEARHG